MIVSAVLFDKNPYSGFVPLLFSLLLYILSFLETIISLARKGVKSPKLRLVILFVAVFIVHSVRIDDY